MAEKLVADFLKKLLHEVRVNGLKVRKRKDGGIVVYFTGNKKVIIIVEEDDE